MFNTTSAWFIVALVIGGMEMMSGTFYLLVVALGCAVGGISAFLGTNAETQYLLAAATAIIGTLLVRAYRKRDALRPIEPTATNVGHPVIASKWKNDSKVRVRYRGSDWDAELARPDPSRPTDLVIVGQDGNKLIVEAVKAKAASDHAS